MTKNKKSAPHRKKSRNKKKDRPVSIILRGTDRHTRRNSPCPRGWSGQKIF